MFRLDARNKSVIIIPDLHAPFSHKDAYKFLKAVKKKYKPNLAISLGDEVDFHAISFHDSIPEMDGAGAELKKAKKELDELETIFEKLYILDSNHGSLLYRRLTSFGVPLSVLKPLKDLYEKPKWTWHNSIMMKTNMGQTYMTHGKSAGYDKLAKEMGVSCIQGHFHTKFCLVWLETLPRTIYNMICGCLADRDHMAFAYSKSNMPLFQLGCAMIDKNGYPTLIRMNLKSNGRWDGKLPT